MASILRIALLDPCRFQKPHHYDQENIKAIAADLTDGSKAILNPVHVIPKGGGRWEIVAGHDRVEAARAAGFSDVPVRDFGATLIAAEKIYEHWRMDNVLRKQPNREEAATETLVEWAGKWSDRRVATVCGVSHPTVGKIRSRLEAAGQLETVSSSEGKDGKTRKRRTTGSSRPEDRKPKPAEVTPEPEETTPPPMPAPVITTTTPLSGGRWTPSGREAERKEAPEATEPSTGPKGKQDPDAPEVGAPTGATAPEMEITQSVDGDGDRSIPLSDKQGGFSDNPGAVQDRLKSTSPDPGLEDKSPLGAPQSEISDVPPVSTSAVRVWVRGRALAALDAIGPVLPDIDDPDTVAGLAPSDRKRFMALSSWAIRIAGKCPNESSNDKNDGHKSEAA